MKMTFPVTRPDAVTLPYVDPKLVLQCMIDRPEQKMQQN